MAGVFETIFDSIRDAAGFFVKKPKALVLEFTKVAAIGLGVQMAFLFLVTATGIAAGPQSEGMDAMFVAAAVAIMLIAIAFFIVSTALSATPYCIVDEMRKDRRIGIISKTRELLPAVAGYCGVIVAIFILAFGIALGGGLFFGGDPIATGFLMLGALSSIVVAVFLLQFALSEMAVNRADALGALKSSFLLVTRNVWIVLIFDIILVILLFGTVMVFSLPQGLIEAQLVSAGGDMAVSLLLFGVSLAVSLLETVIVSLISVNLIYCLWKALKAPMAEQAPEPQAPDSRQARWSRKHSKQ